MVRIAWALINYGPIWAPAYASHLRAIAKGSRTLEVEQIGGVYACGATDRMYTHSAENRAVEDFLDSECTHLFLTESDMILPDDTLPMLAALEVPIASGVYFLRGGNGQPCLYKKSVRIKSNPYPMSPVSLFPTDKPFKLNGCPGLGCVLIQRQVFARVPRPWFDLKEGHYGSDLYFYTKVQEAGVDVWVHPQVACDQIDYTVVGMQDYHERLQHDPSFAGSGYIIGMHDRDIAPIVKPD